MARSEFRTQLMESTRVVHERLHAEPRFAALQAGTISDVDYDGLMHQMGAFYVAFDSLAISACQRIAGLPSTYRYQPRQALFKTAHAANCDLPQIDSLGGLAGALYVVDGAVLGGQVLGRGLKPQQSHPYWVWCAREGAAVWRATNALIDHADTGPLAHSQGIAAACAVFSAFEQAMDDAPVRTPA